MSLTETIGRNVLDIFGASVEIKDSLEAQKRYSEIINSAENTIQIRGIDVNDPSLVEAAKRGVKISALVPRRQLEEIIPPEDGGIDIHGTSNSWIGVESVVVDQEAVIATKHGVQGTLKKTPFGLGLRLSNEHILGVERSIRGIG